MKTLLVVLIAALPLVASAEGVRPCPVPLRVETASCQQKLCPGPKRPLVLLAEGDWQHMKRPLVA